MRLGGPLNFGQPSLVIGLAQGAAFYPPAGVYLVTLGGQTAIQFFDPTQLTWRNLGTPLASDPCWFSTDGYQMRMVNMSGVVQGALITNAGSGGLVNGIGSQVTGVNVTFAAPTSGQTATAYPIIGGQIGSTLNIVQAGSGFVVPPLIYIDPPPIGGIQATATCTISPTTGAITGTTVTNQGAGYVSVPTVYVMPQWLTNPGFGPPYNAVPPTTPIPPGLLASIQPPWWPNIQWPLAVPLTAGALLTANAITGSGTLTGIVMIQNGNGYTGGTIPAISFAGGGLAGGVAATAIMSMAVQSIAITSAGVAYTTATTNPFISTMGEVISNTATQGVQALNNDTVGPRPCRGQANTGGGTTIASTVIEDPGFGFQKVPTIGVIQQQGTAATTVANLTPTVGGIADVLMLQPAVFP